MNGGQDAGGMMGFGPVAPEPNEPVFHAEWEKRVFALTLAMGMTGSWNIDISRHARERRPPQEYWSSSYYEIWLKGLERLLADCGLVSREEIASGQMQQPPASLKRRPNAKDVPAILAAGGPSQRQGTIAARFSPGDKVRARNINPTGHTRLPRYMRGHVGTVVAAHGLHVFPDSNALGQGETPQWLYTIAFTARELWGHDNNDSVTADLWESYLEAA
jgi:nitrile hydratase